MVVALTNHADYGPQYDGRGHQHTPHYGTAQRDDSNVRANRAACRKYPQGPNPEGTRKTEQDETWQPIEQQRPPERQMLKSAQSNIKTVNYRVL